MLLFSKRKRKPARAARQTARPAVEVLESRLAPYAASSNAWPCPQLITIGFEPDGTPLGGGNVSNLMSTFNARFGSAVAWQNQILKAAQTWAQQTNINFAVVNDSGAPIGSGSYQQGDPSMPDVRIGGYNFGANTLAQTYMPPPVNNTSYAGDVQFNTGQSFCNGNVQGSYDLYTVAVHEIGHALGLYHSTLYTAAMYGSYTTAKTGLASDDISGVRSIYSAGTARSADPLDAAAGNTTITAAADLTSVLDLVNMNGVQNNLDVTTAGMARYYKVTAPLLTTGNLMLTVQSAGLSLLAPKVTVYAADQVTVLATASAPGYTGGMVTVNVPGVVAGQVYYVKVQGYDNSAFGTGAFALSMSFGMMPAPMMTPPNTMTLNGLIPSNGGGQAIKLNPEFMANTTTANTQQTNPYGSQSVAIDGNGNSVVVWQSQGQDGSGWGIYAQRYNADGTANGGEFRVNTTTAGDQMYASVAMSQGGAFVVTWSSYGQDGSGWGVYAQRYNADGTAAGGEFQVNTTTAGDQKYSSVAMDQSGDFVVTWSSNGQDGSGWGVYAQRYSAAGTPLGGEFRVNTTTAGDQTCSSVAMDQNGDFVVTWSSSWQDGWGWGVYAQRYSAAGTAVGGEFRVNTTTFGDQEYSSVAMNPSTGTFVITWSNNGYTSNGWGIYAQRYSAAGTPLGGELHVNTTVVDDQIDSSVAMDQNGNFVITWSSQNQDGSGWGVYVQQYDPTGTAVGSEFRVNTTTQGDQQYASVTMNAVGQAVAVWSGNGATDSAGVFGQRLLLNGASGLAPMGPNDTFDLTAAQVAASHGGRDGYFADGESVGGTGHATQLAGDRDGADFGALFASPGRPAGAPHVEPDRGQWSRAAAPALVVGATTAAGPTPDLARLAAAGWGDDSGDGDSLPEDVFDGAFA